jgi:hypothetical protein
MDLAMQETRPGILDDANFDQHWSVSYWRGWSWPPPGAKLTTADGLRTLASEVAQNARQARVLEDSTSAAYWAYHVARTTYFTIQCATCVVAHAVLSGDVEQAPSLLADSTNVETFTMNTVGTPSLCGCQGTTFCSCGCVQHCQNNSGLAL